MNGTSVNGMDHQSVVALLMEAGTSVCLVVSREVYPVSDNEVSHHIATSALLFTTEITIIYCHVTCTASRVAADCDDDVEY